MHHLPDTPRRPRRRTRRIPRGAELWANGGVSPLARWVAVLLTAAAVATIAGMAVLWPRGSAPAVPEHLEVTAGIGVHSESGQVIAAGEGRCDSPLTGTAFRASSTVVTLTGGGCRQALVEIESGPDAGSQTLLSAQEGPGQPDLQAGDDIRLTRTPAGDTAVYAFEDFSRGMPLALWAIAAAVVVCIVGAWRGVRALLGVAIALVVVVGFTLPSMLHGNAPVAVALVSGSAILFAVVYLAHGVNLRSSAALLGTLAALGLAALLSWSAIRTASLTGLAEENSVTIQAVMGSVSVTGLLLAGFIIGSLGVLNDVTISQAATVFELAAVDRTLAPARLFTRAMRVGRDHIASMVYTLVLAYAGGALPLLIIFTLSDRPLLDIITSDVVAVEVVRSLVGAMAVVASVPLTTMLSALLTRGAAPGTLDTGVGHSH